MIGFESEATITVLNVTASRSYEVLDGDAVNDKTRWVPRNIGNEPERMLCQAIVSDDYAGQQARTPASGRRPWTKASPAARPHGF